MLVILCNILSLFLMLGKASFPLGINTTANILGYCIELIKTDRLDCFIEHDKLGRRQTRRYLGA